MEMHNASLMRLEANVTALADAISTIESNNGGLNQLGLYKNETEDLDSRLAYLEGNIFRQPCSCIMQRCLKAVKMIMFR